MDSKERKMKPQARSPVELATELIQRGIVKGDLSAVDELVGPDFVEHQYGAPDLRGPDAVKAIFSDIRKQIPDIELTIEDIVEVNEKVWMRMRGRGTHALGKPIELDVIDICRFQDGLMVEHWGVPDRFALLDQLGVLPKPPG
jgi:predicted SnoaL-like aldol condensation-catalyzing enzyme